MKIAVIGFPRTGSTKLCMLLTMLIKGRYLGELIQHEFNIRKKKALLGHMAQQDNYVVKFFSFNFDDIGIDATDWTQFDLVIATSRANLVDAYISVRVAHDRDKWIKMKGATGWVDDPFTVDVTKIEDHYGLIVNLAEYLSKIEAIRGTPVVRISYETTCDDELLSAQLSEVTSFSIDSINNAIKIQSENMFPTGIDYKTKCLNYVEVEEAFRNLGLI